MTRTTKIGRTSDACGPTEQRGADESVGEAGLTCALGADPREIDDLAKRHDLPHALVKKIVVQEGPSRDAIETYLTRMKKAGKRRQRASRRRRRAVRRRAGRRRGAP